MNKIKKAGLSIVIPVLDEGRNIDSFFKQVQIFDNSVNFNYEIIFVDGGSKDESMSLIKKNIDILKLNNIYCESSLQREGYGSDIAQGLSSTRYLTMCWTHADLQTKLTDVKKGYEIFTNSNYKNLVLKGKRLGRPLIDKIQTFGMSLFVFMKCKLWIDDINAQPKIFPANFYDQIKKSKFLPNDFSLDLFLLAQAKINNFKIETCVVNFKKRMHGHAKGGGGSLANRLKLIRRTINYINRIAINLKRDNYL